MLAVSCAAIAFNQSAVHWRENIADDCLYAYGGWRLLHGSRPYVDVWDNKPPGIWWANSLAFAALGEGIDGEIVLGSIAILVSILAFTSAVVSLLGPSYRWVGLATGALFLTHQRFECGANRTETYVAALETLAVAAYLKWASGSPRRWLSLAFLAAGAAPWFKQSGLAALAACGLHFVWTLARRRRGADRFVWAALAIGALGAPTLLASGILVLQGSAGAAWDAIYKFNKLFFKVQDATWTGMDRVLPLYWPHLITLAALWGWTAVGIAWHVARRAASAMGSKRRFQPRAPVMVVVIWLLVSFYLACVGSGRQAYHLAPVLGPMGILGLYGVAEIVGPGKLAARLVASPLRMAMLVVFGVCVYRISGDSWRYARAAWSTKTAWYSLERRAPADFELQAAALQRVAGAAESVYVWGWDPGAYRFAYRQCPSRFATIEHVSHVAPYGEFIVEGAIRDIRRAVPAAIMISTNDWQHMQAAGSDFARWLRANYRLETPVAGMELLVRNAPDAD